MDDALRERVDALERAVTDGDCDLTALTDETEAMQRLEAVETQLDELEDTVAELEAATQALRGYVGNVRSVNRDVEQRADAALAKARELEDAIDDGGDSQSTADPTSQTARADATEPTATTSADGGAPQRPSSRQTASKQRCEACGQLHDEPAQANTGGADMPAGQIRQSSEQPIETETDRAGPDAHAETQSAATESAQEEFPESTEETGTLQRVREML
jgi:DNA repair exonuclease SbcCD ATPase subunit